MSSEIVECGTLPEYDSVPRFEEAILEEEEYDGQAYVQSEIVIDLRDKNHVFNQTGSQKSMTLYDMLCDNQSTCDVVVNASFVINIRFSTVILVMRTQAGEYRINQIADLPVLGTVQFYLNGVANILSQHRMVVNSGWDIEYSTKAYRRTGDIRELKYVCVTSEGVKVIFTPNKEGLHILDCRDYFGLGKSGCVFGQNIIDNNTNNGFSMCHSITGTTLNNDVAIDTVEKSKQNFTKRDQLRAGRVR